MVWAEDFILENYIHFNIINILLSLEGHLEARALMMSTNFLILF
jgi:hypothetical protein